MESPTLTTERLILRPLAASDAAAVQRLAGAREVAFNTLHIPHPYTDGIAEAWIEKVRKASGAGGETVFAIVLLDTGELAGAIGITPKEHDKAEIGYWIGVPYWGRGYATEAAAAVIAYGFERRGLNRIEACHFTRNPQSGRVLAKCGMRHEGTLRQAIRKWDDYVDVAWWSILRSEWAGKQSEKR